MKLRKSESHWEGHASANFAASHFIAPLAPSGDPDPSRVLAKLQAHQPPVSTFLGALPQEFPSARSDRIQSAIFGASSADYAVASRS